MRVLQLATPGATSRFSTALGLVAQMAAGLLFLGLLLLNLTQVAVRSLGQGIIWITDASQLMLLWMVMLGTVAAYCFSEHIVTGFLDRKLRGRPLAVLLVLLRVLEIVLFGIVLIAGYSVATVRAGIPYVQLGISTGWTYAAIPVAAALLLLAAVSRPLAPPAPDAGIDPSLLEAPDDEHR